MDVGNMGSRPEKRKSHDNPAEADARPAKQQIQSTCLSVKETSMNETGRCATACLLAAPSGKFKFHDTSHIISDLPDNSILLHSTNCLGIWGPTFAAAVKAEYPMAKVIYKQHCDSFIPVDAPPGEDLPRSQGLVGTCLLIPPQSEKQGTPRVWIACLFTSYSYGKGYATRPGKDSREKITAQTRTALECLRVQLAMLDEGKFEMKIDKSHSHGPALHTLHFPEAEVSQRSNPSINPGRERRSHHRGTDHKDIHNLPEQSYHDQAWAKAEATGANTISKLAIVGEEAKTKVNLPPPSKCIYSPRFNAGNFAIPWNDTKIIVDDIFGSWDGKWYLLQTRTK